MLTILREQLKDGRMSKLKILKSLEYVCCSVAILNKLYVHCLNFPYSEGLRLTILTTERRKIRHLSDELDTVYLHGPVGHVAKASLIGLLDA